MTPNAPTPRVLALASHKGGSGKTTTAVNLAAILAGELARRVLLVDLDAQGAAGRWTRAPDTGDALLHVLTAGEQLAAAIVPSPFGLDVAPSSPALTEAALSPHRLAVLALRRALDAVAGRYDVVVIDTPPTDGIATTAALVAATDVLAPVDAMLALPGLASVRRAIADVADLQPPGPALAVVVCRADLRQRHARAIRGAVADAFGSALLATTIGEHVAHRDAALALEPIAHHAPTSAAAADYRELAREILARWETTP